MEVQELLRENIRSLDIEPVNDDLDVMRKITLQFNTRHGEKLEWSTVVHHMSDIFHPDFAGILHDDMKKRAITNMSDLYTYLRDVTHEQLQGDIELETWERNGHDRYEGVLVWNGKTLLRQKIEVKCSKEDALEVLTKSIFYRGLSLMTWVHGPQQ